MYVRRIFFTGVVAVLLFLPQGAVISQDNISARILGSFAQSGSYDIHPTDWFVNTLEDIINEPIKKPKDIYNFMYYETKEKPTRVALQRTLEKRQLTRAELERILPGEDVALIFSQIPWHKRDIEPSVTGPLLEISQYFLSPLVSETEEERSQKYLGADIFKVQPGELTRALEFVLRDLSIETEMAALEAELEAEVVATEIFSDGDENNSGFDLITDLEVIELLLFGEPVTLPGISGPGNPPGANEIAIGDFAELSEEEEEAGEGTEAGAGEGEGTPSSGAAEAGQEEVRPFTPAQCYADSNFDEQIRDFETRRQGETGGEISGGGTGEGEEIAETRAQTEEEIRTPQPVSNWRRAIFCPAQDVWCFQLQAKMKRESSYLPTDNCIACHIEKINDAYNKTVRSNLIPGKATGNLIEIPTCKKGFSLPNLLNFNFVAIPSPIITPPNDDLVVKDVFLGNIEKFIQKYYDPKLKWNFLDVEGKMIRPPEEIAADRATAQFDRTNVTAVTSQIAQDVAYFRQQALDELKKHRVTGNAERKTRFYKALEAEVDQMNAYFETFGTLFQKVLEADGPCNTLRNKPQCS